MTHHAPLAPLGTSRLLVVVFAILLPLARPASAEPSGEVEFQQDIEYGTGGGEKLFMNIARPKNAAGPLPAVVLIHGGGWAAGQKEHLDEAAKRMAAEGYVAATIGYRLAPKHPFPAQVEDCKCAVRHLRAHAEELGIDSQRIGALGYSAGAHLAMMLGFMDSSDGLEGEGGWPEQSSKVQAVVAYFGPTQLDADFPETSQRILEHFLGGNREEKRELYRQASPLTYVNEGDAPVLIFQGTKDELVPHDQAIRLVDALTEAGVPGRIELMLGAGHGWAGKERERSGRAAAEFFDEHLRKQNP